eukprot:9863886-Ditylum_brightwellii.AAC.1
MRVGFLLAAIKCSDTGLQSVVANIKLDADETSATSKRHHFKLATTYLLPFCPVLKKILSDTKHDAIKISGTTVNLRYHTAEEYDSQTQLQSDELCEWCNKSKWGQTRKAQGYCQRDIGRHSSKHENCKQGRAIASVVYKTMRFLSKKKGVDAAKDSSNAYIMSLFKDKDVKKAIRASVLSTEVMENVLPANDAAKEALSMPYVVPKMK